MSDFFSCTSKLRKEWLDPKNDSIAKLIEFAKEFWKEQEQANPAMKDKVEHVMRVVKLAKTWCCPMVSLCAYYHDIGRVPQLELLGSFNDAKVLHHHLGTDLFEKWLYQEKVEKSPITDMIREVIAYHGRLKFMPCFAKEISPEILFCIEQVSVLDDIDNVCVGAVQYLDRESDEDTKEYIKCNPTVDQTQVSPEVLAFFFKAEKFDKLKYCKTYADYVLFALMRVIVSLKEKNSDIAADAMDVVCEDSYGVRFTSAIEAYKAILYRRVDYKIAPQAYAFLCEAFNNADIG